MRIKTSTIIFIKIIFLFVPFSLGFYQAKAQTDSTKTLKNIPVKEAFLNQFEVYKAGKNITGLLDIADHNHYPSPEKVLTWQKELQLNERQKAAISLINKELQRKVKEMNRFLITNESTMDSLFKNRKVNNGTLIFYTNRYGLYQGELRNALLQACVKTEAQLTSTQIKKYDSLLQY